MLQGGQRAENLKITNDTISGGQYAKTCYQANTTLSDCALFPVQSLPYTSTMVACPFGADPSGENSCITGSGQALQMDTGYLDTDRYLGINAAPSNRVLLRNVVTCSPLRVKEYVQLINNTDPDYPSVQYNLGAIDGVSGYTYQYQTHTRADVVGYQITPVYALDGGQTSWYPVSALNVSNADVSAHFLSQNSIQYLASVADPWLSSNQLFNDSSSAIDLVLWGPDQYVDVMACIDQYQLCNPNSSPYDCTILGSGKDLRNGFLELGLNAYQLVTARRLALALILTSTYHTVNGLGSTALLARDRVLDFISTGLPANQWQIEMEGWFATSLAKLQAYVVEYAANVADLGPTGSVVSPAPGSQNAEDQAAFDQCSNQRIRNVGGYQSFSFLGLMIVICVGSTIILLSWIVEPLLGSFRRWRGLDGKHDYREIVRIADHTLQLQRKAFQGAGFTDGWDSEHLMDSIPVTVRDTLIPVATRYKANGVQDYRYTDGSDNDSIGSEQGQPMEENRAAQVPVQPHIIPARPAVSRGPSMQPLLQDHI
ncbi:hypothetical protein EDD37DRAFT_286894 [Exophiala viscosa]|uniref:uncharacterized protein n=1 Tax=Exophiala viscosa TaxID=2486360 RepID=UPI0021960A9B|nr:hypothetical protein EDD37DRAFT_286894 [Exophiala viscosa]